MTTRLIAPLVRHEPPLAVQAEHARAAGADLVELRVDLIGDVPAVEAYLSGARPLPCILTIRPRAEGGAWEDDDASRVALMLRLGLLRPEYIDIELVTWRRSANLRQKVGLVAALADEPAGGRNKAQLIVSSHDLNETPDDSALVTQIRDLSAAPGHVAKAVYTCRDATDAIRILSAARRAKTDKSLMALGMGESGGLTRILAPAAGLFGVFAALERGGESAPGQFTVAEMLERYRFRAVSPATRLYGVIGWPVAHSHSPQIHNAGMRADGIDGVYLPLPVAPSETAFFAFMDRVADCPWLNAAGFSVTIPHKENALAWLRQRGGANDAAHGVSAAEATGARGAKDAMDVVDAMDAVDEFALRCGAVNTLARSADGHWQGANTDVAGLLAALQANPRLRAGLADRTVRVLGAGGVARAAIVAAQSAGAHVIVHARDLQRSAALAGEFGARREPWDARRCAADEVLIQCTPVGMHPVDDETPLPAERIASGGIILDTIYNPAETRLLREAAERGCTAISGVDMFRAQASAQYQLWHGRSHYFAPSPLGSWRG